MHTVYILYVEDSLFVNSPSTILGLGIGDTRKFPILCLCTSTGANIDNVVYDKRSCYLKFKNQKRYYRYYMDIFKYIDSRPESNGLLVKTQILGSDISDISLNSYIKKMVILFRLRFGNSFVITDSSHKIFLDEHIKIVNDPTTERIKFESDVSKEERKQISAQKYSDTNREKLNAKSRRYYERNKELIKQKRLAKNAENTAQPNTEIAN